MKSDVCILHEIKNSLQEKKQTILQLLDDMNYRINEVWSKQEREYIAFNRSYSCRSARNRSYPTADISAESA